MGTKLIPACNFMQGKGALTSFVVRYEFIEGLPDNLCIGQRKDLPWECSCF